MTRIKSFARVCAALVVSLSTGCAVMGGGGNNTAAPVSLAGSWMLNVTESSDTARATLRGLDRAPRAFVDPAGTTARRGGTFRDTVRAGRVDGALAARVLAAARQRTEQLTIADSAGVITLRGSEHDSVVVTPDGRSARRTWLDGTTGELRARWVQQRLEIVRRLDGGITVQEYYSRSPGGSRLVVFAIVKGPFDGEIAVRRVYDCIS
jgi:hypothetical protein